MTITIHPADLAPAIRQMGELLASADEGLGHLTCGEIQGAIDLLIKSGMPDVAADVVYSHAMGDDDLDDVHHEIYLALTEDGMGDALTMARDLVASYERGEPVNKFRTLMPNGNIVEYATRDSRDDHGPHLASAWCKPMVGQFWAADNPQDSINEGWAADAVWRPTAKRVRQVRIGRIKSRVRGLIYRLRNH